MTGKADQDEDLLGRAQSYDGRLMARLWAYVRPHRGLLAVSVASLPLIAGFSLLQPYLLKVAIDDHLSPRQFEGLVWVGLLFLGVLAGEHAARFGQSMWLGLLGQRAVNALRQDLYRHLFNLRAAFFDRQPVGRLMTRLTSDVEAINEAFAAGLVTLIGDVVTLLGIVIAMLLLNFKLALFALASAPVLFFAAAVFRRLLRDAYRNIRHKIARINGFLQEQVSGVKVVQICVREAQAARDFDQLNREHRDANFGAIGWDAALYAIVETLGNVAVAVLLWWGAGQIAHDTLTFGVLVAFIEYLGRFYAPIRDLSTKFAVMQQAMASSERIFKLLDTDEPDALVGAEHSEVVPHAPLMSIQQVTFAYSPGEFVLRDISLDVHRGHVIALVGSTGAGKTTLIRLLTRLYEPTSGEIRLEGRRLSELSREELRQRIAVVPQDGFLFSGRVCDNITLWNPALTDEIVRHAADRVGLLAALSRRGRSLADPVGERGVNLSAGERQLVALTRALAHNPEVLVLDEATSNVDPETERLIEAGTAHLLRGRTSIVIAHRLSTIERADTICVLHHGRIHEEGSHASLLAHNGIYTRLYRLQIAASSVTVS